MINNAIHHSCDKILWVLILVKLPPPAKMPNEVPANISGFKVYHRLD